MEKKLTIYGQMILDIMLTDREQYWKRSGGKFTHRMPTFWIRKLFNQNAVAMELSGPEMLKAMKTLCKYGYVVRHPDSRIGQAYWQLTDKAQSNETES